MNTDYFKHEPEMDYDAAQRWFLVQADKSIIEIPKGGAVPKTGCTVVSNNVQIYCVFRSISMSNQQAIDLLKEHLSHPVFGENVAVTAEEGLNNIRAMMAYDDDDLSDDDSQDTAK